MRPVRGAICDRGAHLTPKPKIKKRVQVATCEIFSTSEMRCHLCNVIIPPCTQHSCKQEQP